MYIGFVSQTFCKSNSQLFKFSFFICLLTYICEGRAFLIQFIVVLIHCCYSRNLVLVEFCEGFVWHLGISWKSLSVGVLQCNAHTQQFPLQFNELSQTENRSVKQNMKLMTEKQFKGRQKKDIPNQVPKLTILSLACHITV